MGISEFTVHNVLRTYTRQERLGQVQKARGRNAPPAESGDRVSLSRTGQKVQWLRQLAEDVTSRRHPELGSEEKLVRIRDTREELLSRHREELGNDGISPETFESWLRPLYLD